jgi:hypothetical protein
MFTVDRIRIRFHCRIILVIFNPCECTIRIEPVIIPVVTTAVFPIEHTISFDGDADPGMNCRVTITTQGFSHCL